MSTMCVLSIAMILFSVFIFVVIKTIVFMIEFFEHINFKGIKLSFDKLKTLYKIAPSKYTFCRNAIAYYKDCTGDSICIRLSFADFIKYRFWMNKLKRDKKFVDESKLMEEFLTYTDADIEAYKKDVYAFLESRDSLSALKRYAIFDTTMEKILNQLGYTNNKEA